MIVVAMEEERRLVKTDEPVLVTGVGAVNVIRAMKDIPRDTPILNLGFAGSNSIPVGTEVKIGKVALYHPNAEYDEPVFLLDGDTPCFTSCDFVLDTKIAEPCVFDMELAFILAMGFTDVRAVKTVSDTLDMEEFERCLKTES
jgi:hypothetical protein